MDFSLTDEQELVRDTARALLARECPASLLRAHMDDPSVARPLWGHLREFCALGTGSAPLIARTVALQDLLGSLHDEDVAAGLARTFLIERNRDLTTPETAAIGRFVARAERDMRRHRAAVPRTWRGVGGATFRRSLGRLLAAL